MESLYNPKIKSGGSSSSNLLNRFFDTVSQEMGLMLARTNALALRCDRLELSSINQAGALLAQLQSVSTRVDAASGYTKILCDLHQATYVDTLNTTADISYDFGQATLPVRSSTNLLTQQDAFGNTQISNEVDISYAVMDSPSTLDFISDPEGIYMLREEQAWVLPQVATDTVVWTKIKAPLQYRGLIPNVLELYPLPSFALELLEVSYQLAGQSFTSSWTPLDISYLPLYSSVSSSVDPVGPVRIHLPGVPLSQIRIKMKAKMNTVWGWSAIKLFHREYDNQATLVVQDPYSRTVSQPLLRGKDPAELSLLSTSLNSSTASITLTTPNTINTPVITGVILNV